MANPYRNIMQAIHPATLPPQAPEIEQAILGALMLDRDAYGQIAEFLTADHFYVQAHADVYAAICELQTSSGAVDIITVSDALKSKGKLVDVGGVYFVSSLTNKVASAAHIQAHARIVQQKFMLRTLRSLGAKLVDLDETEDVFDIMNRVNEDVGKINALTTDADAVNAASIMSRMVDNLEMPTYITADMGNLDQHFAMGPKQVTVIGARPAVGKTAFALNMAMNIARQGHPVMFITLEMSAEELVARIASALTGIDSERITRNELSEHKREVIATANAYNGAWIPRMII